MWLPLHGIQKKWKVYFSCFPQNNRNVCIYSSKGKKIREKAVVISKTNTSMVRELCPVIEWMIVFRIVQTTCLFITTNTFKDDSQSTFHMMLSDPWLCLGSINIQEQLCLESLHKCVEYKPDWITVIVRKRVMIANVWGGTLTLMG